MRVLLIGAGGPAANSFARSLRMAGGYHIIGANRSADDLRMAEADETHILPHNPKNDKHNEALLLNLVRRTKPDFAHSQPDEGVRELSRLRDRLGDLGCRTFLPPPYHIDTCQDKWLSYLVWHLTLPVPRTALGDDSAIWPEEPLHIRPRRGAGGKDSLRRASRNSAITWLADRNSKDYTVAEHLAGGRVTWQALYRGGALVACQLRRHIAWTDGDHGSSRISETFMDRGVEALGVRAVRALGGRPHGIYGVDMTLDAEGRAHVTEINIGRFFTTIEFFAHCGLNMPDFYCKGAPLKDTFDMQNPLEGQKWIRCMDKAPVLVA